MLGLHDPVFHSLESFFLGLGWSTKAVEAAENNDQEQQEQQYVHKNEKAHEGSSVSLRLEWFAVLHPLQQFLSFDLQLLHGQTHFIQSHLLDVQYAEFASPKSRNNCKEQRRLRGDICWEKNCFCLREKGDWESALPNPNLSAEKKILVACLEVVWAKIFSEISGHCTFMEIGFFFY